jgi:UDP-N-acetyl-D-glucosamine dehydrogenase
MPQGKLVIIGGLGYVGLPLALLAQEKGWTTIAQDINQAKVADTVAGRCPLPDPDLAALFAKNPLTATTDYSVVSAADVIVVTVPTPVTAKHDPDLEPLTSALTSIKNYLHAGQLLIIESTVNPGVMDEIVVPLLADITGLHLVYCPERINPGDQTWTIRNIPRVLGGYTPAATAKAEAFYHSILEAPVKIMKNPTEAEAVKIIENTFRDINIAFVNEMAKSFDRLGIDIINVIEGAATKPFAFLPHYPGAGVGGHCISVDPYYMIDRGRHVGFDHRFLKLAREINESMPAYTIELLFQLLTEAQLKPSAVTVTLLGLAYKKNVADTRESPAYEIARQLEQQVKALKIYDPYVPDRSSSSTLEEAITGSEAIVLATAHTEFTQKLTPDFLVRSGVKVVIDGRNALPPAPLLAAGMLYHGIGRS